ncbi:MAG: threonine synthase, partial [Desulfococcaceae bacterium]
MDQADPPLSVGETPLDLMDGANGKIEEMVGALDDRRRVAADSAAPLESRLEAYEDIIDSE